MTTVRDDTCVHYPDATCEPGCDCLCDGCKATRRALPAGVRAAVDAAIDKLPPPDSRFERDRWRTVSHVATEAALAAVLPYPARDASDDDEGDLDSPGAVAATEREMILMRLGEIEDRLHDLEDLHPHPLPPHSWPHPRLEVPGQTALPHEPAPPHDTPQPSGPVAALAAVSADFAAGKLERDEAIARLVSAGCTQGAAEIHLRGMMLSKRRADGAK